MIEFEYILTIIYLDFLRLERARIEKRAKPPLMPAPIEKPLAEATISLRNFSKSANGIVSKPSAEEEHEEGLDLAECAQASSCDLGRSQSASTVWKPPFSPEEQEQKQAQLKALSPDGDMVASWLFAGRRSQKLLGQIKNEEDEEE